MQITLLYVLVEKTENNISEVYVEVYILLLQFYFSHWKWFINDMRADMDVYGSSTEICFGSFHASLEPKAEVARDY